MRVRGGVRTRGQRDNEENPDQERDFFHLKYPRMPQGRCIKVPPPCIALFFGGCGLAGNSTLKQAGEQERYRLSVARAAWTTVARHLKCFITRHDVGEPTVPGAYEARRSLIFAASRGYVLANLKGRSARNLLKQKHEVAPVTSYAAMDRATSPNRS